MQTLCPLRLMPMPVDPGSGSYCRGHVVTRLQADLDYWLARWWGWRERPNVSEGYYTAGPATKQYRTSRQYDDQNGALDEDVDCKILEQFDHEIHQLEQDQRIAVQYEARRLNIGVAVFMSPRLPTDKAELAAVILMARAILTTRLVAAGVLSA
jgi:hypothetical protein